MTILRKIWVTFQRKGFHFYPGAPEEVSYLATRHRHLFKFKVTIGVEHNERDIEFHMFQTWLEGLYDQGRLEASGKSCETIATELLKKVESRYPGRLVEVEVSEDGEFGSVINNYGPEV